MGSKCATKVKGNSTTSYSHSQVQWTSNTNQSKLYEGRPILIEKGLKIIKNPETNKLEGMPEQWVSGFDLPLPIDFSRVISTESFRKQIKPDEELPLQIFELLASRAHCSKFSSKIVSCSVRSNLKSDISNIKSEIQIDHKQPYGIKNMPEYLADYIAHSFDNPKEIKKPEVLVSIISHIEDDLKSLSEQQFFTSQQFEERVENVDFIMENPAKNFKFKTEIGKGGICKVFKAQSKFAPGAIYAVRILKDTDLAFQRKIKKQIALMEYCSGPNIIDYYFTYYYKQSLFMFIEYMNAGSLADFIKCFKKNIPQPIISLIIKEICIGLSIIHSRKQIHRDIKSDNILLNQDGNIKIADFGYALQLTEENAHSDGLAGTTAWMAPELIKKEEYNQKVDIWSLGIVIVQLCEGQPPYLHMQPLRAMYKIATEEPPTIKRYSKQLQNLVECCLKKQPNQRLTAKQLLSHPFLSKKIPKNYNSQFIEMINKEFSTV